MYFNRYTDTGFTINGVDYEGSVLCVGNLVTSWAPKKFSEITADRCLLYLTYYWNIISIFQISFIGYSTKETDLEDLCLLAVRMFVLGAQNWKNIWIYYLCRWLCTLSTLCSLGSRMRLYLILFSFIIVEICLTSSVIFLIIIVINP